MVTKYLSNLAKALMGQSFESLSKKEQNVIEALASGEPVSENTNQIFLAQLTLGERLADEVARVVGSWGFIVSFFVLLIAWMGVNTFLLASLDSEFDPYPYILLNLVLSTLASVQAPVIMMSQNRQAEKDRIFAANAFEVNLKTELSIQQLHTKVDKLLADFEKSPNRNQ